MKKLYQKQIYYVWIVGWFLLMGFFPSVINGKPASPAEKIFLPENASNFLIDKNFDRYFDLSGAIYLFKYTPFMKNVKGYFEVYAFLLNVDAHSPDKKWGLHVQSRFRDRKLRAFYPSAVWFQEAYAYWKTDFGELHAGKFYRKVGLFWDGSFLGNVHYFNGLKLNPDFGVEWTGRKELSSGLVWDYSLQFFTNNDNINGALPGRDVESDTIGRLVNTVTAKFQPEFRLGEKTRLKIGLSGMYGRLQRTTGNGFTMKQTAVNASLNTGKVTGIFEVLIQDGEALNIKNPFSRKGYDNSTYFLTGLKFPLSKSLRVRLNQSWVNYRGLGLTEMEFLPGLVYQPVENLSLIVEYDHWKELNKLDEVWGQKHMIDHSLNIVAHYTF